MPTSIICRSCDAQTEDVINLGQQRLSDFPKPDEPKPPVYPLQLVKCQNCHLVQLKQMVSQNFLYHDNYSFKSGISQTIRDDLREIVGKAQEHFQGPKKVLDIGSNDGTLLDNYSTDVQTWGFEPVDRLSFEANQKGHKTFHDYFRVPESIRAGAEKFDIITAISVFYDMPNPNRAAADLAVCLADNGVLIIQQNYLPAMLLNNAFDNISHEHLSYYSLASLEHLLNRHYLEVFKVEENSINGGSFRTYVCHKGRRKVEPSVAKMRQAEKKLRLDTLEPYKDFEKRIRWQIDRLEQTVVDAFHEGRLVYAYGASTRGSVILQASGAYRYISKVVERNPEKVGRTYLGIPIISEEEARRKPPEYALILPYFFSEEIMKRERDAGYKGRFLIPLPEVKVV